MSVIVLSWTGCTASSISRYESSIPCHTAISDATCDATELYEELG